MDEQVFNGILTELRNYSLAEKMGLIETYNLHINVASAVLNIPPGKLASAKADVTLGLLRPVRCDGKKYKEFFEHFKGKFPRPCVPNDTPRTVTVENQNSNTVQFFNNVTTTPQRLDDMLEEYSVSMNTARQYKRFDPFTEERGKVKIRNVEMDDGQKSFVIWREPVA